MGSPSPFRTEEGEHTPLELRMAHGMGLEVLQAVEAVDVGLGAGRDDVGVGALAQGHQAVFPQPHGHLALGVGPAAQGADRKAQQFGLVCR
jgi:hypothetical protein